MMGGAASGSGSGAGATVFTPPNQGAAAQSLQDVISPLLGLSANAGAGTPAGINYPIAQGVVANNLVNNPYANQAIWGSDQAAQNAFNIAAPQAFDNAQWLRQNAAIGLADAQTPLNLGFDPRYSQAITDIQSNPYYGTALQGAQDAATMGRAGANAIQGLGTSIAGQVPQLQGLAGTIGSAVNPLLQSGFDPRSALFNRSEGRLMDQTNAINAMSGLAGTPYGASVGANAMSNFDIDWADKQLARQIAGAGAAGTAAGAAGGLYNQAGSSATTAGNLYGAAPGLLSSTAAGPSNVYTGQINQVLEALKARMQGANAGIAGYGSLLGSGGTAMGQATNQNLAGIGAQQQYAGAPYNTQATIGQNALSGLTNLTNLGNNQFTLPQQEMDNLMRYMGLGQNASSLSGQLGNLGFQQTAQGLGGLLSGGTALLGSNGPFSSGGALGGLFGGGGGGGLASGDMFAASNLVPGMTLADSAAAAAAGGGGLDLAAAAPFALSA